MSAAHSILAEITERGIAVRVEGETLRLRPRLALDDGLLGRIKEHKAEIIRVVLTEGSDQVFHWPPESLATERRFRHSRKTVPFFGPQGENSDRTRNADSGLCRAGDRAARFGKGQM